jgi:competence protein ComGC
MKKKASGAIGYLLIFMVAMIMVILTMYMVQVANLMTHQCSVDDALADATLATLVADDAYYFETAESGNPVMRFRNVDESHDIYVECLNAAVSNERDFFQNVEYQILALYEVENGQVRITTYSGNYGNKMVSYGSVGSVTTPNGKVVQETSAYAKISFDIKSLIDGSTVRKARDIYCTLEINES